MAVPLRSQGATGNAEQTGCMASAGKGWSTRTVGSPQCLALLSYRCDEQTSEMLKASFGHCDGAEHMCTLELETHVTRLGQQLQALGCSRETPGTPAAEEQVSRALRCLSAGGTCSLRAHSEM